MSGGVPYAPRSSADAGPQKPMWQQRPLPADVARVVSNGTRLYVSSASHCKVLVSHEPVVGWHLSISHEWRYPSWEEIKSARYELVPDAVRMTMDLPPSSEFVNVHENCFHLYECRCGGAI
jgi:hypothetical protein